MGREIAKHRRSKKKKTVEVQCRWTKPAREGQGPIFDFMKDSREWHKHRCYESVADAQQAIEQLNHSSEKILSNGFSFKHFEYRLNPDHQPPS